MSNKIFSGVIIIAALLFLVAISQPVQTNSNSEAVITNTFTWVGKWQVSNPNQQRNFFVILKKENGVLKGRHCYASPSFIDCAADDDISLNNFDSISSTVFEANFITFYSPGSEEERTGRVQLKKLDANIIEWQLKEKPTAVPPTPLPSTKIVLQRVN